MKKASNDQLLLMLTLSSAVLVTALRFFHAIDPTYDAGIQLRAGLNLLAGDGLSTYQQLLPDFANGRSLVTLTYFPAGYSLASAALIALGLSVGTTVKVLGGTAGLLGWWGWCRLARPFFNEGMTRGSSWRWAAMAIAIFTPAFFTPRWGGTDIFLWAVVPWVIVATVDASRDDAPNAWRLDWLAGALCGVAVLMRYASLFLVVYAACLILWQSRLQGRILMRRWTVFGIGLLPALLLQAYVNYVLSNAVATPGGLLSGNEESVLSRLWVGVRFLHTANTFWTFWIPDVLARRMVPGGIVALRLGITSVAFVALLMAFATYRIDIKAVARDSRTAALGLFLAVPLTLLGCTMLSSVNFVAEPRYYWPIVPLSVFVAYSVASRVNIPPGRVGVRTLQRSCTLYLIGFVAMSLVYTACLFLPAGIAESPRSRLMGSELHPWPSMAVTYEFSPARRLVMRRLKEYPGTLLLTSNGAQFFWDPAVDGSRTHELNCAALRPASVYVTAPARILIHSFDEGQERELWYYAGNGRHRRAECFERFQDVELLQRFPAEGFKILEARVAGDQRIELKP
jgi:hypothetical protein